MLAKGIVIVIMIAILYFLFSGLFYLVKDKGQTERTIKSLSWRIELSILLFFLLFAAYYLGLIHPHDLMHR